MTTGTPICSNTVTTTKVGTTIPFDAITEPGAYVCNWSGHLLRVPETGVRPGHSPMINIVGDEPLTVTKISENPFIAISRAKMSASEMALSVRF